MDCDPWFGMYNSLISKTLDRKLKLFTSTSMTFWIITVLASQYLSTIQLKIYDVS